MRKFSGAFYVSLILMFAFSIQAQESSGRELFEQNCASCHTIGGGRGVGPDLKGVTARRPVRWLEKFIADPAGVIASGDPYAKHLKADYNGVTMPATKLTRAQIRELLSYIRAQSKNPTKGASK